MLGVRQLDAGRAPMHEGNARLGEDGIAPAMAQLADAVVVDVQDEVEGRRACARSQRQRCIASRRALQS